jgi:hypothetical protein
MRFAWNRSCEEICALTPILICIHVESYFGICILTSLIDDISKGSFAEVQGTECYAGIRFVWIRKCLIFFTGDFWSIWVARIFLITDRRFVAASDLINVSRIFWFLLLLTDPNPVRERRKHATSIRLFHQGEDICPLSVLRQVFFVVFLTLNLCSSCRAQDWLGTEKINRGGTIPLNVLADAIDFRHSMGIIITSLDPGLLILASRARCGASFPAEQRCT